MSGRGERKQRQKCFNRLRFVMRVFLVVVATNLTIFHETFLRKERISFTQEVRKNMRKNPSITGKFRAKKIVNLWQNVPKISKIRLKFTQNFDILTQMYKNFRKFD